MPVDLLKYIVELENVLSIWEGIAPIRDINPVLSQLQKATPALEASREAVKGQVDAFRANQAA